MRNNSTNNKKINIHKINNNNNKKILMKLRDLIKFKLK